MKELFPLLEPVFFWLANALELYNFLVTHRESLHLPAPVATPPGTREEDGGVDQPHPPQGEGEEEEEDPVGTLYSVMVYAYQKAFYPVSKVRLYVNDLPLSCDAGEKVLLHLELHPWLKFALILT